MSHECCRLGWKDLHWRDWSVEERTRDWNFGAARQDGHLDQTEPSWLIEGESETGWGNCWDPALVGYGIDCRLEHDHGCVVWLGVPPLALGLLVPESSRLTTSLMRGSQSRIDRASQTSSRPDGMLGRPVPGAEAWKVVRRDGLQT